jgi:catechol 2,3-dioxygenase-like lactoylglutathione lyase family enzyme
VSLITLGVSDLERAVAFYRDGLGWPKSDVGVDVNDVEHGGFSRFSLAHNVAEERRVDSVLAEAAEAGATIIKEAQEIFFGRHGFFADPDGFLWEVAWNPSFPMGADGSIELPD